MPVAMPSAGPTRVNPCAARSDVRTKLAQPAFTSLQGQYLAFIRAYTLIHREPPAEADMQQFFGVTPPTVHNMVLALAQNGLVERIPGKARSLRVVVSPEVLPGLVDPLAGEGREEPQNNQMQRTKPAPARPRGLRR